MIEKSIARSLDASKYIPIEMPGSALTVTPFKKMVNEASEW
jgi:hypothetical protein